MRLRCLAPAVGLPALVFSCGGKLVDDLPPLPPPNTPPIVAPNSTPAPAAPPRSTSAPLPPVAAKPASVPPRAPSPPPRPEPSVGCALSGRASPPLDLTVQDESGRPIARFSGSDVALTVSALTLAATPRARLETGTPRGSFRIRGLVNANQLPVVTTAPLVVSAGCLWIGERRAVSIRSVSRDRVEVTRLASKPLEGTFSAVTTCSSLSLDAGTPPGWSPAGDARGYALRQSGLELYESPQGSAVGSVRKAADQPAVLFFSTEQRDGYVHVERHADIVVDAWAKAQALSALPRGETLDQEATASSTRSAAHLAAGSGSRVLRTTHEVALRAKASDSEPLIGVIGPDTDTIVVDVVAGWVSVLPRALDVLGADGAALWAKKTELEP